MVIVKSCLVFQWLHIQGPHSTLYRSCCWLAGERQKAVSHNENSICKHHVTYLIGDIDVPGFSTSPAAHPYAWSSWQLWSWYSAMCCLHCSCMLLLWIFVRGYLLLPLSVMLHCHPLLSDVGCASPHHGLHHTTLCLHIYYIFMFLLCSYHPRPCLCLTASLMAGYYIVIAYTHHLP